MTDKSKLDMKNAIVAAYVEAYKSGLYAWSREQMLEKLAVELTKELHKCQEELAIGIAQKGYN